MKVALLARMHAASSTRTAGTGYRTKFTIPISALTCPLRGVYVFCSQSDVAFYKHISALEYFCCGDKIRPLISLPAARSSFCVCYQYLQLEVCVPRLDTKVCCQQLGCPSFA